MVQIPDSELPRGAVVLVTGANGYVGSHVAAKLLQAGYKVRGTVRSVEKQKWLKDRFDATYGPDRFELVPVLDLTAPHAFDEAVKGVSAVAHVANVHSVSDDPRVIEQTVKGSLNAIQACEKEPLIKRFVYTSSLVAVYEPRSGQRLAIDESTYNHALVVAASEPPTPGQNRHFVNHSAAKTKGELAIWDWVRGHRPSFGVNSVLPGFVLGRVLDPSHQGYPTTANLPVALRSGHVAPEMRFLLGPTLYVDVEDCALLHVAGLALPGVEGQRIFAMARQINGTELVQELRSLFPAHEFPDVPDIARDDSVLAPIDKAEALLKRLGLPGWTSLREALKRNMAEFA